MLGNKARRSTTFGQVVIGPPGSGKTSYCKAMQEFCTSLGRKVAIVNIDPANDVLPYQAAVDIASLIRLEEVMETLKLGPNGGLVYCMEYLEANLDWLLSKLDTLSGHYILIDCPGQVSFASTLDHVRVLVIARYHGPSQVRFVVGYFVYTNGHGNTRGTEPGPYARLTAYLTL